MKRRWVIGTPAAARAALDQLASHFEVDEVMLHPVAGAPASSAPDRNVGREQTLSLLAVE